MPFAYFFTGLGVACALIAVHHWQHAVTRREGYAYAVLAGLLFAAAYFA